MMRQFSIFHIIKGNKSILVYPELDKYILPIQNLLITFRQLK